MSFLFLILALDDPVQLHNEATTLLNEGRYRESLPLMEQVLAIRESGAGAHPLEIANTLHDLGRLYTLMVYQEKAESTLKRALEIREMHLGAEHVDTGRTVALLADFYRKVGRLNEADPLFAKAIRILEQRLGEDTPDLVEVLRNLAKLYRDTGKYSEARSVIDRAVAICEKKLSPDDPRLAIALHESANLLSYEAKHTEAEALFRRALQIQEKTIGPEHPDTTETMNGLALLQYNRGKYEEAETLHKRILLSRESRLGPGHPHVAGTLNNLAIVYFRLGRFREASELVERAVKIEEKVYGPDHYHVNTDLNNLATFYTAMGRYTDAEPLYLRVLQSRQKNPAAMELGHSLNNLGVHYRHTGRYDEAEPLYKQAQKAWEELGPENPLVGVALSNLGVLYHSSGRYTDAEPLLQKSLAIREKALGSDHFEVAVSLHHLGNLYRVTGRAAEAESLFSRALQIWEKRLGPGSTSVATVLNSMASLYRSEGRTAEAEPLLQRALQIREKSLGADHPDVARTLLNLASLQAATRRHKEAQALFLRGIRTTELIRESIFTLLSERQKLTFVHRQSPSIHTFVQHTSQFLSKDPLSIEGAFSSWLQWKGAVQEAQGRYLNALILSEDPVIREKWEELQSVRRQIARLWVAGPGRMNLEIYRRILSEHEKKRELLEAELSALSQPYALERRVGRADPARIAELLPENSLYLDYARVEFYDFLNDQPQQSHYVVFALAKGPSLHLIDLGQSEKIDSLIQDYRKHINEITNKGRLDRQQSRQMKKLAAQLNQHLIKPIDSLLVNRKHLLVSPDGLLHLIPLEALVQEDGQYLLQKFRISYLASGRDIVRWADPALPRNEAVVMADPDFELSPKPQEISAELRGGISGRFKEMSLARLPDSRKEGAEVAK
ncbi:MAG TPA: tetratricopeptide repeat protein, partial [Acidobacteriota bacterium]